MLGTWTLKSWSPSDIYASINRSKWLLRVHWYLIVTPCCEGTVCVTKKLALHQLYKTAMCWADNLAQQSASTEGWNCPCINEIGQSAMSRFTIWIDSWQDPHRIPLQCAAVICTNICAQCSPKFDCQSRECESAHANQIEQLTMNTNFG